jgi:hypothetical protein
MQDAQQKAYFHLRAEEERVAADKAADQRAAQSHRSLAARYDAKANGSPVREIHEGEPEEEGQVLPKDFRILP